MSRFTRSAATLIALASLAAASGCGGGGSSNDSGNVTLTSSGGSSATTERIIVGGSNSHFSPEAIYERAAPGVVTIISVFRAGSGLSLGGGGGAGLGSGFVVDTDGNIATNAHVVTNGGGGQGGPGPFSKAKNVYVQFGELDRVPAKVVGFDPFDDIALIHVDPSGLDLVPLTLGSDKNLHVGQPVAAIGSPFAQDRSLSVGVISATGRLTEALTKFKLDNVIQTDASINPGNSGGPLLDAHGNVIGVNRAFEGTSQSSAGVGFAVPVSAVRKSLDQLKASGHVDYAFIGISSQGLYPQLSEHLGLNTKTGALIASVIPGGPADQAGLKGGDHDVRFQLDKVKVGGDVVLAVDGDPVTSPSDLSNLVIAHKPGDTVTLKILRDGSTRDVQVTLGKRPSSGQ